MMWSCQLCTELHTHVDSNGVVGEQRETHFLPQCVIKQWRHPPRRPGQRGIEGFWKDLCFTMAVIDNVIRHGCSCVCLCVFPCYGGMQTTQKQRQRRDGQ